MPSPSNVARFLGGSVLFSLVMTTAGQAQAPRQHQVVVPIQKAPHQPKAVENEGQPHMGGGAIGGPGVGFPGGRVGPTIIQRPAVPPATGPIAEAVVASLSSEFDFDVDDTLAELPQQLSELAAIPVLVDDRGVDFAKVKPGETTIQFKGKGVPLSTALRTMLRGHALKTVVEDEGLVITADHSALVHRGIGATRWTNIDQDAERRIAAALDTDATLEFIETPLEDVCEFVASTHDIPVIIDRRALEEIGLSVQEPVTLGIKGVKLRSGLSLILRNLDLTYTVRGEALVVTTIEDAEFSLLNRIYWFEGTGLAPGDFQSIIDLIQTSIVPDTWEALGGPSTMAPLVTLRPAILISTTYDIHEDIDAFFQALRETHFGVEPVLESVEVPASVKPGFGGGGGGGGLF